MDINGINITTKVRNLTPNTSSSKGVAIPTVVRNTNNVSSRGVSIQINPEISPIATLFGVALAIPLSKGFITLGGDILYENGTAYIQNTLTSEFYSVPITNGSFDVYNFYDSDGNPVEILITVETVTQKGTLITTLNQPQNVFVGVVEALSMAVKIKSNPLGTIEEVATNDYIYAECCYNEKVFANPADSLWWKNDKSSFLLKKILSSDTINYFLYKDDVKVTALNDNTLGEYYEFELYTGFVLYWENVYNAYGSGSYQVKAEKTILGIQSEFESQEFCLSLYSDEAADKTVRIETYQTGSILRSGFNYDELGLSDGLYQSYRISGHFGNKKPSLESDYLMTSDRKMLQIQDKVSYEYILQTGLIPYQIGKILIEDNVIANRILITDYNLFNTQIFRRVELYPSAINDVKTYPYQRNLIYEIAFKERFDNILKRN